MLAAVYRRAVTARACVMIALSMAVAAAAAQAQPAEVPGEAPPVPPVPIAPPAGDAPALVAQYDRAFGLLVSEQWEDAAKLFAEVAARSVDAERRGAAAELGRFAREMDARAEDGPKRSSGRASFVATTTMASFYAGFVLDDILAVEDIKAQTLVVTGVTLGGFTVSLLGSSGVRITDSMASAYGSGLLIGAGNGLLLAPRLGLEPDGESGDGEVDDGYLGFGLVTMAAGGVGAMYLADLYDPTAAQAQFAGLMGLNGLMTVGLGMVMLEPDWDYENILAALAIGLDAGVVGGVVLGRDLTWSKSRLTYVTLAEFLGGLTGVAAAVVLIDEDGSDQENIGAGLVLAGVWGGFALATHLTRDLPPDPRYRSRGTAVSIVPIVTERGGRGVGLAGTF